MKSDSDRTTLHRELGTVEYRSMTNPVEKAAHLHLNTGATKKDCAQICDASYDAVKRAVKAIRENRPIQRAGRPHYLCEDAEHELAEIAKKKGEGNKKVPIASLIQPILSQPRQ
ncbi:hypothetical protein BLNAU_16706 [Blattamonas nauphoetae]|uniref:Uncharacterized protein n=1 Tax=Blattamonas nauphoetae TaxID=2049346 RepID=A0ABQ9WUU2_9EUKA|nr:hypothetical protein BLNAU_21836 [Blattamonas nauphoetae]KAK2947298.1 hypothetical protein BLNAU_17774 [Blattamonas nauphoetae]KAK2948360.1 hypothetical protein BLNAU_16706 [Blattamonas nauphoetae]